MWHGDICRTFNLIDAAADLCVTRHLVKRRGYLVRLKRTISNKVISALGERWRGIPHIGVSHRRSMPILVTYGHLPPLPSRSSLKNGGIISVLAKHVC